MMTRVTARRRRMRLSATQPRLRVVGEDVYANWDAIYVDNVTRIYRLMYSKVGNRPDAEDLTAEVFVAALGPLRVSASRGEVRSYLVATARTVLAGYWRRRLGVEVTAIDPDAELRGPDEPDRPSQAPETGSAGAGLAARALPPDPGVAVLGGDCRSRRQPGRWR